MQISTPKILLNRRPVREDFRVKISNPWKFRVKFLLIPIELWVGSSPRSEPDGRTRIEWIGSNPCWAYKIIEFANGLRFGAEKKRT